ncbi:MAG: HAMP domain-containing protein [Acidimicrobiia bacterium]|nr:HAMP domain-containing protein [Acidimicrobiia bacterium]
MSSLHPDNGAGTDRDIDTSSELDSGAETAAQSSPDDETDGFAVVRARLRALPWWRRPRRLRRQLSLTLVLISLLSVLLVGGLNFVAASELLDEGTEDQLVGTGQSRARSIENGVQRVLQLTSSVAADLAVINALEDFEALFPSAGTLDEAEQAELDAYYEENLMPQLALAGVDDLSITDIQPQSDSGRYLQYHYIVESGVPDDERVLIDDAGDGSGYSEIHAEHHPYLSTLKETLAADDLMLISAPAGEIVYTTDKRVDFGVDLSEGPYTESKLAATVLDRLPLVRTGDSVFSDVQIYIPANGDAVAFVASAVRSGTNLLGALVLEVPVESLSAITTADGNWETVGLGAGESYVVGADELLRSESRKWIEDPERYLSSVDDDLAERIERAGSPVLVQPVDTDPVATALDGDEFQGDAKNYLGTKTLAYSTPLDVPGVDWVVVAEVPLRDARSPLYSYALRMLLVVAIIVPLAALVGAWLANRSTRPVGPVVDAAAAVAGGDRDPDLPELGRDEFGDLGHRLHAMAADLGEQERELEAEYNRTRELLMTVLPPRLVGTDGAVADSGAAAQLATAIAVNIAVGAAHTNDDTLDEILSRVSTLIDEAADDHGVDRVRVAADRSLYIAGLERGDEGPASAGADEALAFVDDARQRIIDFRDAEAIDVSAHAGLSTGPVGVGVLQRGSVTFGAWGEPVRRALAIGALSQIGQVLVDASTFAESSPNRYDFEPADDVIALDGSPMGLHRLVLSATADTTAHNQGVTPP